MKTILLILVVIICSTNLFAVEETLSYWKKTGTVIQGFSPQTYPLQAAKFYVSAPCSIKKVKVYFFGVPGKATVWLTGALGGTLTPDAFSVTQGKTAITSWQLDNIAPPQGGTQSWELTLTQPLPIYDNQFYIIVGNFSNNQLFFACDTNHIAPYCSYMEGTSNIKFGYQQIYVASANGWAVTDYAPLCDVTVEYPSKTSPAYLKDVTASMGIPTNLSPASIATADFDEDGYIDLLVGGKLLKNNAGTTFTDITQQSSLSGSPSGNAFLDMNNDGKLDILFLQTADGKSKVYTNNGNGSFTEKVLSIPPLPSLTSFSIADINGDKYPDIFMGQLWGTYPEPLPNYFFLNNKNDDFTDDTKRIYPKYDGTYNYPDGAWDPANYRYEKNRNSRGSQWVDYDNDGDLDLFVTNYFLQYDEFYQNDGKGNFTDIIETKGIDVNASGHNHGTGVDWYDYDNDGDMDLLLSQFAHPRYFGSTIDHRPTTIYNNSGLLDDFSFRDTYDNTKWANNLGFAVSESAAGAAWGDVNNDRLPDFISTVFYNCQYADLFVQLPTGKFENQTFIYGLEKKTTGWDACWVDFDNDGKLDLAMSDAFQFRLYKNSADFDNNFVEIEPVGSANEKYNVIGARVKVYCGSEVFTQEVSAGRGQKMQKPSRLHFGLGKYPDISSVEIRWPGSTEYTQYENVEIGKVNKIYRDLTPVNESDRISDFFLSEPSPNPAPSFSSVEIHIPYPIHSTLKIFNTNGVEMRTLLNTDLNVGKYTVELPVSGLESGVYYCRLSAGEVNLVRKFVVIK
ncbi:MAG: UnbV protein [Ignavibacteria bacterium]|nr:UnbV protein [Ignavibacteria bacterium]